MPKNTVAGPSIADDDGVTRTFEEPLGLEPRTDEEADGGERPLAGSNSSESGEMQPPNSYRNDGQSLGTAPNAGPLSPQDPTDDSDVSSPTTTSSTESGETSLSDDDDDHDPDDDGAEARTR